MNALSNPVDWGICRIDKRCRWASHAPGRKLTGRGDYWIQRLEWTGHKTGHAAVTGRIPVPLRQLDGIDHRGAHPTKVILGSIIIPFDCTQRRAAVSRGVRMR